VHTNQRVLEYDAEKGLNTIANDVISENAVIIPPCYIGENVKIVNSIVGPHVSIGKDSVIENSIVKNTIIQNKSSVINALLQDSMIGNQAKYQGSIADISLGDFSTIA
jgi:glucose-1-phosphate thymidylyltransferase